MSKILDDARRLAEAGPYDTGAGGEYPRACIFCGAEPDELPATAHGYQGHPSQPHAADCPWRAMPRIVAALEAAARLSDDISDGTLCNFCTGSVLSGHFPGCPLRALVAAIGGPDVPLLVNKHARIDPEWLDGPPDEVVPENWGLDEPKWPTRY